MTDPNTRMSKGLRIAGLVATVFVLAAGRIAAGPATRPVQRTSDWGPEVNGLRARLLAPAEIEHNAPLTVSVELRCDPASLPPGIARFDRSRPSERLRLTLTNSATGRAVELKPFDLYLLLASDVHENTEPLGGRPLEPIQAVFLLRSARDALTSGAYDCTVTYSDPGHAESTQRPQPKDLWAGELHTAPMRITIKPEVLRPVTFLVPKRLRLTRDQKVAFLPEDAERVTVKLGNGMFLGMAVSGDSEMLTSGTPEAGGPNPIDDWHIPSHAPPPGGKAEYTIEIFATGDPPHHMWMPAPGSHDYVTLWRKTFIVRQPTVRSK
jgi:hypothetical protein